MEKEKALGYLLSRCARTYKRLINSEMERYDLTAVQCGVIRMLNHFGELTQVQIAEKYASDKATMGKVILSLIEKGFLHKKASTIDKRAYVISLTERAQVIAAEIEGISNRLEDIAFSDFSKEEKEVFRRLLGRMIDNMDHENTSVESE